MKVLLTGSRGLVGRALHEQLLADGDAVVSFDLEDGQDVCDGRAVREAAQDCSAVLHLAAELPHPDAPDARTMAVNVQGTRHVLQAAEAAGAQRVVFYSSVNALGIFMGEGTPDYLPIDDDHPCDPASAYGISKLFAEEMCRQFTARTGIATICLRPPAVWTDETAVRIRASREEDPAFEWSPYWEYGAFVHVRDAASAGRLALRCEDPGHVKLLLCADDISSAALTSRQLAEKLLPDVPWRGGAEYEEAPFRALLDTHNARRILDWTPSYRWRPAG